MPHYPPHGVPAASPIGGAFAPGFAVSGSQAPSPPAFPNKIFYSRDLASGRTAGKWLVANSPVTVYDAVGMEGIPNTATTLGDDSSGSTEYPIQHVSKLSTDLDCTCRIFVKKGPISVDDYPSIAVRVSNNSIRNVSIWFDPDTGNYLISGANPTVYSVEVNSYDLWWEIIIYLRDQWSGTSISVLLMAAAGYGWPPTGITGAQGSIIIGNVEMYIGALPDDIRGKAPVFTTE